MRKFALATVLALQLAVCGCANNSVNTELNTTTSGNWLAQLTGGTGQATLLDFTTGFSVENSGPLTITGFSFLNSGLCFGEPAIANQNEVGSATLTVNSTDQVTGSLTYTITSTTNGNILTLVAPDGGLTGTSNGSPGTTGTLSNGVAVGSWKLSGAGGDPTCMGTGTFIMCQTPTGGICVPPASREVLDDRQRTAR